MTTKIKIFNLTCCPNFGGNYIVALYFLIGTKNKVLITGQISSTLDEAATKHSP
jgi:hypothetical protein